MSRQGRADAAGYAAIHDAGPWETMALGKIGGSSLYGGTGHVPRSVSVGRKGQGKILTPKEIRQIKVEQKADIKAARAAKRGKKR